MNKFTSEDYHEAQIDLGACLLVGNEADDKQRHVEAVVRAALLIASRVMRPGIIQKASEDYFAQCESFDYADEGAAIRKALTE